VFYAAFALLQKSRTRRNQTSRPFNWTYRPKSWNDKPVATSGERH
jgi:hypothetical protein